MRLEGITADDLAGGYGCDPATKSDLRIAAKPGVVVRLSRNFDKQRGFVNGVEVGLQGQNEAPILSAVASRSRRPAASGTERVKIPESTRIHQIPRKHTSVKSPEETKGPGEMAIQNKAPREYPGCTPGESPGPGDVFEPQRRKLSLW